MQQKRQHSRIVHHWVHLQVVLVFWLIHFWVCCWIRVDFQRIPEALLEWTARPKYCSEATMDDRTDRTSPVIDPFQLDVCILRVRLLCLFPTSFNWVFCDWSNCKSTFRDRLITLTQRKIMYYGSALWRCWYCWIHSWLQWFHDLSDSQLQLWGCCHWWSSSSESH